MTESVLDLAEATSLYSTLEPGEELLRLDGLVLLLGLADHERCNFVQRVRLSPEGVADAVGRVREEARRRGKKAVMWELGESAQPPDLGERLLALGMQVYDPPGATIMTLADAPVGERPGPIVTPVETVEEFKVHVRITHEVFGILDRLPAELDRIDRDGERKLADRSFVRFVARLDGRPVGAATASFTPIGAMLYSGSTLKDARGRGVYTAMVAARLREAGRRGAQAVATRASDMSRPILEKHGFAKRGELRLFVDRLG
jgi:GNAT superfamily N-acetyltransferase